MKKAHSSNPLFVVPKLSKNTFSIVHTAKEVEYTILGFREKNLDELSNLVTSVSI